MAGQERSSGEHLFRGRAASFVAVARALSPVLLTLTVMSAAGTSARASGWSIQPTPLLAGPPQATLNSVSCTSSVGCVAVGDYVNRTGIEVALVEHWNGAVWSSQPTPSRPGNAVLNGVSCEAATDCVAVGDYINGSGTETALAEHWDGSAWTIQLTPDPSGATGVTLSGVSCSTEGPCMAVGRYISTSGATQSLAESWNGSTWSIAGTPAGGGLSRVSCTAATACTAVDGGTLVERWNGSGWATQAFAVPTGTTSMQLNGVTCSGAQSCVAGGHWVSIRCNNGQPTCNCLISPGCTIRQSIIVEWWNGISWTVGSAPSGGGIFYDVSCPATSDCTAVGRAAGNQALAAQWDGADWIVQSTPPVALGGSLSSVSCTAANACTAVGHAGATSLAERWDGMGWTMERTVNPAGPASPGLSGASCPTTTACTAVGNYTNASGSEAGLAEYWNGTSWSQQRTVVPSGSFGNFLAGVACTSPTVCTGTGAYSTVAESPPPDVALSEEWNGAAWVDGQALTPSGNQSVLAGVSCPAAVTGVCQAVGYAYPYTTSNDALLAEQWNGSSWALESAPTPAGTTTSSFLGVSCTTGMDCMAVGTSDGALLAERLKVGGWALNSPPGAGVLSGVSCAGSGACMAVGNSDGGMLAEGWNGTTWTAETLPLPTGSTGSSLAGVSCPAANDCIAVGDYTSSAGKAMTLAEQWNGTTWTIGATPNPASADGSYLTAVSCTTATACTAVGHYQNSAGAVLTLVERYSG